MAFAGWKARKIKLLGSGCCRLRQAQADADGVGLGGGVMLSLSKHDATHRTSVVLLVAIVDFVGFLFDPIHQRHAHT